MPVLRVDQGHVPLGELGPEKVVVFDLLGQMDGNGADRGKLHRQQPPPRTRPAYRTSRHPERREHIKIGRKTSTAFVLASRSAKVPYTPQTYMDSAAGEKARVLKYATNEGYYRDRG